MNNLYETLEICLQDIEQGADVETVLFRYPDLAEELRPILEASAGAKNMAIPAPSAEVVRRNRAKVMQHVAQMREAKAKSSQRIWFASLRRMAVTLAVVAVLFMSGTGLVRAASATLPGDNLYPVKRTWEDVLLFFTFNLQEREALEIERENERLHELTELFARGLSAEVDFAGTVTSQNGNEWIVNGVRVLISPQTEMRDGQISVGSAVRVKGWTQGNDAVLAERIRLLSSDDKLPEIEYEHDDKDDNSNEGSSHQDGDNSGPGSGNQGPSIDETETPESENSNSGSGNTNDSSIDDPSNDNSGDDNSSNDNSGNDNDNSGSNDNSNSIDNNNSTDNDNGDDSSGGNDNSGGGDQNNNDNGDDSGGGDDNSGSGGGGGGDGDED